MSKKIRNTSQLIIRESIEDLTSKGPFEILEKYKRRFYLSFYEIFNQITKSTINDSYIISVHLLGDNDTRLFPEINIEININDKSIIQNILIPYFIKQAEYNISFKLKELDAKLEEIQQRNS